MMLSGCAGNNAALFRASQDLGRANVGVSIADQPAECGVNTPHAATPVGAEALSVLKREQAQLNAANEKRAACFDFNKTQISGLRTTGAR
jgi:hypothetical protein